MAHKDDIAALHAGDDDLISRDFQGAKLSGIRIGARDFSKAQLMDSNFRNSDLSSSVLSQAELLSTNFEGAILRKCQIIQTAVVHVSFKNADLSKANLSESRFAHVNFSGADLTGANFSDCGIDEGCIFDGTVTDEHTNFNGASIYRPLSGNPAFRHYSVERGGLLKRRPDIALAIAAPRQEERRQAAALIDAIEDRLPEVSAFGDSQATSPGIGHNNPPEDPPLTQEDEQEFRASLREVKAVVASREPETKRLNRALEVLQICSVKIAVWLGSKLNRFADEFVAEAGKTLGSKAVVLGTALSISGYLAQLIDILKSFIPF